MSKCKHPSECIDSNSCALMHECAMDGPRLTERVQVGSTVYEKGTLAELAVAAVKRATPVAPGAAAQGEVVRVDERLVSAVDLLKRLKRDLMHARRFSADTLATYRRACSNAEGDVEEWLKENSALLRMAAPSTGDLGVAP